MIASNRGFWRTTTRVEALSGKVPVTSARDSLQCAEGVLVVVATK